MIVQLRLLVTAALLHLFVLESDIELLRLSAWQTTSSEWRGDA
jgi:hypothetical protein